jgi:hypothetical protein
MPKPKPNRIPLWRCEVSPRSRSTFAKRQKELARQEKQRAKAERKRQRKNEAPACAAGDDTYPTDDAYTSDPYVPNIGKESA